MCGSVYVCGGSVCVYGSVYVCMCGSVYVCVVVCMCVCVCVHLYLITAIPFFSCGYQWKEARQGRRGRIWVRCK